MSTEEPQIEKVKDELYSFAQSIEDAGVKKLVEDNINDLNEDTKNLDEKGLKTYKKKILYIHGDSPKGHNLQ